MFYIYKILDGGLAKVGSLWVIFHLGHVMRRHGLENLAVTGKVDGKRERGRQRLKYLDSLCTCLKDKVSPIELIRAPRGQVTLASHGRQRRRRRHGTLKKERKSLSAAMALLFQYCLFVTLSVCLFVDTITPEPLEISPRDFQSRGVATGGIWVFYTPPPQKKISPSKLVMG